MNNLKKRALEIAQEAHAGQKDLFGQEYIGHPLRVMKMGRNVKEKIVGILHDVVEDNPEWTFLRLSQEGFPPDLIAALVCLTRDKEREPYEDYINRLSVNPLAVAVKMNDLTDNMNPARYPELGDREVERIKKYHAAYMRLKPIYAAKKSAGFEAARKQYPRAGMIWSTEEKDKLEAMFCEGRSLEELSEELGRGMLGIEIKIMDYRIPDKYDIPFEPTPEAMAAYEKILAKRSLTDNSE